MRSPSLPHLQSVFWAIVALACGPTGAPPEGPRAATTDAPLAAPAQDVSLAVPADPTATAPVATTPAVRPRIGGERFVSLPVDGFASAVLAVPTNATGKRPVLVATHGNYDTPEWQCRVWSEIVQDRGFVLCPRGVRRSDSPSKSDPRFEYASNQTLEKELDRGLAALTAAFPDHVAPGSVVFAGFSLGAIMGVSIAQRRPELVAAMVLIEGGDKWTVAAAKKLAKDPRKRVLFACSQASCAANAKAALILLQRAGLTADLVKGKNEGHTYGGDVRRAYGERFSWVVERDPRWGSEPP